jgi:hypothetical protein
MYFIEWKNWEKQSWAQAENITGSKELANQWNAAHPVVADHAF